MKCEKCKKRINSVCYPCQLKKYKNMFVKGLVPLDNKSFIFLKFDDLVKKYSTIAMDID